MCGKGDEMKRETMLECECGHPKKISFELKNDPVTGIFTCSKCDSEVAWIVKKAKHQMGKVMTKIVVQAPSPNLIQLRIDRGSKPYEPKPIQ